MFHVKHVFPVAQKNGAVKKFSSLGLSIYNTGLKEKSGGFMPDCDAFQAGLVLKLGLRKIMQRMIFRNFFGFSGFFS